MPGYGMGYKMTKAKKVASKKKKMVAKKTMPKKRTRRA